MNRIDSIFNKLPTRLWKHLSSVRRSQLKLLLSVMVVSGLLEIISLTSLIPFLYILTNPDRLVNNIYINQFINFFGIYKNSHLLIIFGLLFIFGSILNALGRSFNLWLNSRMTAAIGTDLSTSAYEKILYQPYEVHINQNSSNIIASISQRVNNTVHSIYGFLQVLTGVITAIGVFLGLIFTNALIAFSALFLATFAYLLVDLKSRNTLKENSKLVVKANNKQVKLIQEGLGSIRDIILGGYQKQFIRNYQSNDKSMRLYQAKNNILQCYPKFLIENLGLIFIAVIALVIVLQGNDNKVVIPILGTFALGAQRLLPLFQLIYSNWAMIISFGADIMSIDNILEYDSTIHKYEKKQTFKFESLILKDICFSYDPGSPAFISNINLEIKAGEVIGIIGQTGSGKSTLADLIMGLLKPTKGTILVNGKSTTDSNNIPYSLEWKSSISHVPQEIYLTDSSIAENIALGVPKKDIDYELLKEVSRLASIDSLISSFSNGFFKIVGERGVKLSGGQRQRIGIARALYKKSSLIILDEATSALDSFTEAKVIKNIMTKMRNITIISISHRLPTLNNCTSILELKQGSIINKGTPSEILGNNKLINYKQ